jgi:hypothetical protein
MKRRVDEPDEGKTLKRDELPDPAKSAEACDLAALNGAGIELR